MQSDIDFVCRFIPSAFCVTYHEKYGIATGSLGLMVYVGGANSEAEAWKMAREKVEWEQRPYDESSTKGSDGNRIASDARDSQSCDV